MNRQVLITGASKGIGLAISQLLDASGYTVIGLARNASSEFPGSLFCCDLSNSAETAKTLIQIKERFSDITSVVNNVGIALPQPFGAVDLDTFHQVYDLNVRVALQVSQAFIDAMKVAHFGRIINLGSLAMFGLKDRSSYSAAKAALVAIKAIKINRRKGRRWPRFFIVSSLGGKPRLGARPGSHGRRRPMAKRARPQREREAPWNRRRITDDKCK